MTVSIEDLVRLGSLVGIPCIIGVTWLVTSLVRSQTILAQLEARMVLLEQNIHSIRNSLQALSLDLARRGGEHDQRRQE